MKQEIEFLKENWKTLNEDQKKAAMNTAYNGSSWVNNAIASGMVFNNTISFESLDIVRSNALARYLRENC